MGVEKQTRYGADNDAGCPCVETVLMQTGPVQIKIRCGDAGASHCCCRWCAFAWKHGAHGDTVQPPADTLRRLRIRNARRRFGCREGAEHAKARQHLKGWRPCIWISTCRYGSSRMRNLSKYRHTAWAIETVCHERGTHRRHCPGRAPSGGR